MDYRERKCKQAFECCEKLLRASQMHTACLRADQKMLRNMLSNVTSALMPPPDMNSPWRQRPASHSWEAAEDQIKLVIQELQDVLSSLIASNGCHATWRQLGPVLSKIPAPEAEVISGPGPEKLPCPQLQSCGSDSMATPLLPLQPQAAMRARLLLAPEFKIGATTAVLPKAGDASDNFRSIAKVRYSDSSRSSREHFC